MTRLARCAFLACVGWILLISGCAAWAAGQRATVALNYPHASGETLTQTRQEHYNTVARISAHDARGLVDDMDFFFMTDRPTRLTRWHDY